MQCTYSPFHKWTEIITEDPLSQLSKSNRNRLNSMLKNTADSTITHEIKPLDQATLDWFTPLYQATIGTKDNPKIFDIYSSTIGKNSKYQYFSLTLFEDGDPIGATIFSERKNVISIAYRIYPHQWKSHTLSANPSLYTEYLINKYGWERGYTKLSHGRDRNPYGLNSHIGLAIFKLSIGCYPALPSGEPETALLNLEEIDTDILLLLFPETGTQITKAILYTARENFEKYLQVTKYPEQLSVEVIYRD